MCIRDRSHPCASPILLSFSVFAILPCKVQILEFKMFMLFYTLCCTFLYKLYVCVTQLSSSYNNFINFCSLVQIRATFQSISDCCPNISFNGVNFNHILFTINFHCYEHILITKAQ